MKLEEATRLAGEALEELMPYCTRIEIAGGVRRRKPDPHDIELVCVPVTKPREKDLFDNPLGYEDALFDTLSTSLPAYGEKDYSMTQGPPDTAGKRAPCGPRYYRLMYKGQRLDVFAVLPPAQWGVIFTLRTGDAGFSHWLVQQGYPNGIRVFDGHLEKNMEVLNTPEEKDVFRALGIEWKDPERRVTEQEFQTWT